MKIKLIFALLLLLALASPASAQGIKQKEEKIANIQRLLKIVGADKLQTAMLEQMMGILKPMFAANGQGDERSQKMLNRFSDILLEEFRKSDLSTIALDLYDKYFSNDEIKAIIAFYESPVGQKTIQIMPALNSESMSRGEKIGEQAGQRAFQRLLEEFPELKKSLQEQQTK